MKIKFALMLLLSAGFLMAAEVKIPLKGDVLKLKGNPKSKNNGWVARSYKINLAKPAGKKVKISADIKTVITPKTKGVLDFKIREVRVKDGKYSSIRYVGSTLRKSQDWKKVSTTHVIHNEAAVLQIYVIAKNMDGKSFAEIKNITWEEVK